MLQQAAPAGPPPGNPGLPEGWRTQWSVEHHQVYFQNLVTGESTWLIPMIPALPPQEPIPAQEVPIETTPQPENNVRTIQQQQVPEQDKLVGLLEKQHISDPNISVKPEQPQQTQVENPFQQQYVLEQAEVTAPKIQQHISEQNMPTQWIQTQRSDFKSTQQQPLQEQPIEQQPGQEQQVYVQPLQQQSAPAPLVQQHTPIQQNLQQQYEYFPAQAQTLHQQQTPVQHQQQIVLVQPALQQPAQPQYISNQSLSQQSIQPQYTPTQPVQQQTRPLPVQRKSSVQRKPVGGQSAPKPQPLPPTHEEKEVVITPSSGLPYQFYPSPPTYQTDSGNYPIPVDPQQPQVQQTQYFPHPPSQMHNQPPTPAQSPHQQVSPVQYTPPTINQATSSAQGYTQYPPPATRNTSAQSQSQPQPPQQFSQPEIQSQQYSSLPIPGSYYSQPQTQPQPQTPFPPTPAPNQQFSTAPIPVSPQPYPPPVQLSAQQRAYLQAQTATAQFKPPPQRRVSYQPSPPPPTNPNPQYIPPPQPTTNGQYIPPPQSNPNAQYLPQTQKPRPQSQHSMPKPAKTPGGSSMMGKFSSKLTSMKKTVGPGSTASPMVKWGSRAALGIGAIGALALGVDAVSDGATMFDGGGGGGGDFSGGGDFGGGDVGGGDFGGGGEDFGGGGGDDMQAVADANTDVAANAAYNEMALQGQENAMQLLDPVGTEYELVPDNSGTSALI